MTYLRNSSNIKTRLHHLFMRSGEKWAIVAFVGYYALEQLPQGMEGLSVICWPKPGATNPDGIRRLLNSGVRVYFCNKLHTKMFWAEGGGLIIGSANLSRNALENSGQHEFAVYINDPAFDINSVLATLTYKEVSEASLNALDIAYVAAPNKDLDSDENTRSAPSFLESRAEAIPKKWKLISWSELRATNEHIKQAVIAETGGSTWVNDNDVESNGFEVGEFVLQVHVADDGNICRANCRWLRIDLITQSKNRPRTIVQITPLTKGPPPPFELDSSFSKKLKAIFNESEWEAVVAANHTVKKEFLQKLEALYKDA